MQPLEVSGVVRPIYGYDPYMGTTHIWVVRRQTVNMHLIFLNIYHFTVRCHTNITHLIGIYTHYMF